MLDSEAELAAYLLTVPAAAQVLGTDAGRWRFERIDDGAINSVFAVHSDGGGGRASLLLKQAPPYVRSVGESFPLSQVGAVGSGDER